MEDFLCFPAVAGLGILDVPVAGAFLVIGPGLVALGSSGGIGDMLGLACRDPAGLKPWPLKGLTRPDGEELRELGELELTSPMMANDWCLCLRVVTGNLFGTKININLTALKSILYYFSDKSVSKTSSCE